jgi:CelD/BcsL family acetyltransferase involved in cellulose biosynthesis
MHTAPGYAVQLHKHPDDVSATFRAALTPAPTPFQNPDVMAAWYATFTRDSTVTPIVVAVSAPDGTPAALMHLVLTQRGRMRVIAFADLGVCDNNAPVLGPGAPVDATGAGRMWRDITARLPAADLVHFEKQPEDLGGRTNPFVLLAGTRPSRLSAQPLLMPDTFEGYVRSRDRHFRKEQSRVWRVFQRHADARFEYNPNVDTALRALEWMEVRQRERMSEIGADYRLDDAATQVFYHDLIATGLGRHVVLGVLRAGETFVGALLGLVSGPRVTFVRITYAGGDWRSASPGRLVIEKTLEALHCHGFRSVDFSIGNYPYKVPFGIGQAPLYDRIEALSPLGLPSVVAEGAKAFVRGSPMLLRLLGRKSADGRKAA